MINLKSVTKEHILAQSKLIGIQDPAVLERTIHAFILLERLTLSHMDFFVQGWYGFDASPEKAAEGIGRY
ncbi:MAG: hypothetical protein L6W00_18075 [Lentisphaeria bacterium]|nr:MAG: hypothetical protein L6W00_18075 [Lentisphaeria bacterium]